MAKEGGGCDYNDPRYMFILADGLLTKAAFSDASENTGVLVDAAQLLVRRAVDLLEEEDMQKRRGVWGSLPPATEPTTEAEP